MTLLLAIEQPSLDIQEVPGNFQQGVSLIAPVLGQPSQTHQCLKSSVKLEGLGRWKGSPCGLSQAVFVFV